MIAIATPKIRIKIKAFRKPWTVEEYRVIMTESLSKDDDTSSNIKQTILDGMRIRKKPGMSYLEVYIRYLCKINDLEYAEPVPIALECAIHKNISCQQIITILAGDRKE